MISKTDYLTKRMKLIRILLWVVIALNAVDAILSFTQGEYADALDKCILAFYVFLLILAYKENEDKDKTIVQMNSTLRDIVRRVKADLVDDIKVEQLGNQGEYDYYYAEGGIWVVYRRFNGMSIPIKFYPFNDDEDFAELQAEELCDKLNKKI